MVRTLSSQIFVHYDKVSKCPPYTAGRYCILNFKFSHPFASIERRILRIFCLTLCLRWSIDLVGVENTFDFTWHQRKKSNGIRSEERAGHLIGPPLPIQLFGLFRSGQFRTGIE